MKVFILVGAVVLNLALHAWAWTVDVNSSESSLYEKGQEASLVLRAGPVDTIEKAPHFALFDHHSIQLKRLPDATPTKDANVYSLPLPTDVLGYFEVRPVDGDDALKLIPAAGSRPAGMLTYAVVSKLNPNPTDDYRNTFLSIQGTTQIHQRDGQWFGWELYPYLGIQAVGLDYGWARVAPHSSDELGTMLFNDTFPKWIHETKLHPYFHLCYIPRYAIDTDRLPEKERISTQKTTRMPPRDFAAYENYLEHIVPYLVKNYDFLPTRTYEILWEPCSPWGWYGTDEELLKMFEVAHRVIHKLDPHGEVAGPTLSALGDMGKFQKLMAAGVGNYLDVVAFHPYMSYPPEKNALPSTLANIRELTVKYAGRELPFIGTEFGYPQSMAGSALNQGYAMATAMLIFKGEKARMHTLFYLSDYPGVVGYGLMYNLVKDVPFGPNKVSPKPGVPMIRAAIEQVGSAEIVGRLDYLGADIWGYVFRSGPTLLAAIWDASENHRTLVFNTGTDRVEVIDGFGNSKTVTTKEGQVTLQLDRMPTYVRGLSPDIYGPDKITPLIVTGGVWNVFRGQRMSQPVKFSRSLGDAAAKEVVLTFDASSDVSSDQSRQNLAIAQGSDATIELQISPTAPLGPTVGNYRIRGKNGTLYRGLQKMVVQPELEIGPLQNVYSNGQWVVKQSVKNISPMNWQGSYALAFGDQIAKNKTLSLKPSESQNVTVTFDQTPDAMQIVTARATYKAKSNSVLTSESALSFFPIQRVGTTMDWSKLRTIALEGTEANIWKQNPSAVYRGHDDLSAKVAYAYDQTNLYVQFEVTDDVHLCDSPSGVTWRQDNLQLGLDVCPGRAQNSNLLADDNERTDCEIGFSFTTRGPEIYLYRAAGASKSQPNELLHVTGMRLEGGRDEAKKLTTYRITLPWSWLDPRGVRSHEHLGIAAAINDSDTSETAFTDRRSLLLFGGIISGKNPAYYGKACFEP